MEALTRELSLAPSNVPPESSGGPAAETAAWVERAREGDQEAFACLVERHERMVLRTGLRLLGRLDLAQDAAQEAFLRLHRHLSRFDSSRELGPWLYRIALNAAHDQRAKLAGKASLLKNLARGGRLLALAGLKVSFW